MTFRVLVNSFSCDGQRYKKGDVFSTLLDLDKRAFSGVVERVDPAVATEPAKASKPIRVPPPPPSVNLPEQREGSSPVDAPAPVRDYVTDEWPKAVQKELIVYKEDEAYFVADTKDPDQPLNPKALKKGQVGRFIASLP